MKLNLTILFVLLFSFLSAKNNVVFIIGDDVGNPTSNDRSLVKLFQSNGFNVDTFFNKGYELNSLLEKSSNCDIFIYKGHGNSNGDLFFNGMTFNKEDISKIKFNKNPLVVLNSVCGSSGSLASDTTKVSVDIAIERINNYSNAFFKAGASNYYAENTENILRFFSFLMKGFSIGTYLDQNFNYNQKVVVDDVVMYSSSDFSKTETIKINHFSIVEKTNITTNKNKYLSCFRGDVYYNLNKFYALSK